MKAFTQPFIGTTAEWHAANPRLYDGVLGIEILTTGQRLLKFGAPDPANPGLTLRWDDLPYVDKSYIKGLPEQLDAIESSIVSLQEQLDAEEEAREAADEALQRNIDAEEEAREAADEALQEQLDSKIDKSVAGEDGTLLRDLVVKDNVATNVILIKRSVSVDNGAQTNEELPLPVASEDQAGVMPKESFSQISDNTSRIEALEGKSIHYAVTLSSDTPDQEDLQAAYEAASGKSGPAGDMTNLDDLAYGKTYIWYESHQLWIDRGSTTTVSLATNTSPGIVRGSSTGDGKVFVENDGSMSLIGWDATQTAIDNKVDKNGSDRLITADEGTKLDAALLVTGGAMTGTLSNPAAAQVRNIQYGTTDMTASTSALTTGEVYFVYE